METKLNSDPNGLTRSEKILIFMYEFGKGKRMKIRYEDIVVGLFKKYPHDFHLKGYPEYPDTADLIHKPLYDFKKKGYVNAVNKVFSLTERGFEFAKQLNEAGVKPSTIKEDRLSRSTGTELGRVRNLEGFILFCKGERNKLSENDLYDYLGVTVRTQKNAFNGRLENMNAMVEELKRHVIDPLCTSVIKYHFFLIGKHEGIINFFTKN